MVVIGAVIVLAFGAVVGMPYLANALHEGTVPVPGDARAFRPFAHLEAIAAYAGPGAALVSAGLTGVRPDGTVDLEADDAPVLTYTWVRSKEVVKVRLFSPGKLTQVKSMAGGAYTFVHRGRIQRDGRYLMAVEGAYARCDFGEGCALVGRRDGVFAVSACPVASESPGAGGRSNGPS